MEPGEFWSEADGDYQVLPSLTEVEFAELKADIEARGVMVPIEFDELGNILDGHHRMRACLELGIVDYPRVVRSGLSEAEKRSHARKLNTARRHLTREQRRTLIADEIRDDPSASNKSIAMRLAVSDTTVGSVRSDLGLDDVERKGADGKVYAAPKRQRPTATWSSRLVFSSQDDFTRWRRLLRDIDDLPGEGTRAEKLLVFLEELFPE